MAIVGYIFTLIAAIVGLCAAYLGIFAGKSLLEISHGDITKILFGVLIILFFLGFLSLPLYAIELIHKELYFLSYVYNIVFVLVGLFLIYASIMGIVTIKNNV